MTAATTVSVGISGAASKYGLDIAVGNSQIQVEFGNYPGAAVAGFGANFGSETAGVEIILMTSTNAAALTTAKTISGYLDVQIGD
jgi:hypothetical protein